jgi:hypothetical protein
MPNWVLSLTSGAPEKITTALAAAVNTVKQAGITPLKFAGGHGATGDYAPLAALAGN